MANLAGVVQQLRRERDQAARTVEQLEAASAALTGISRHKAGTRSRLSAAARARIAAAQRVCWTRVRRAPPRGALHASLCGGGKWFLEVRNGLTIL
jgi:hypothetical protein